MGVTKGVLGEPAIAMAMSQGGVHWIADSRLENIHKMTAAGVNSKFVLLRTPLSLAKSVVTLADISFNTELETIKSLSYQAGLQQKMHQIVIVVEMGDLREGVLPCDLTSFVREILILPNLKLIGIACNLACYSGVAPDVKKMSELSRLAEYIESAFSLRLELISGGNSANYHWSQATQQFGRINNLRIGESILLGCETLTRQAIPGLHLNAFQLIAEVVEVKTKPSRPYGQIGQDAFGLIKSPKDKGLMRRVICALGKQDVLISGITPASSLEILGASSDHLLLDSKNSHFQVGDEVRFTPDYGALLTSMTSPFVHKYLFE